MATRLSGRQLAIMRVLWRLEEASVAEVQEALELERPLAYSTVATVIARMEKKGLLAHRAEGRTFVYRPLVSEQGMGKSVVGEIVERVFGGSPSQLVSHLLDTDQVDADELLQIKRVLRRYETAALPRRKGRRESKSS